MLSRLHAPEAPMLCSQGFMLLRLPCTQGSCAPKAPEGPKALILLSALKEVPISYVHEMLSS